MKKIITQRPKQTKNPANKNHNRNWTPKQIHRLLLELWIIISSSFLGTISHPTGVAWVLWIRFEIWFGKVFYSQPTVWHSAPFFGIETSHVEGWHGGGKHQSGIITWVIKGVIPLKKKVWHWSVHNAHRSVCC